MTEQRTDPDFDMKLLVTTVVGALALAVSAVADPPSARQPPPKLFLSPSGEPFRATPAAPDPLKTWFDQADTKHQGFLDKDEFRADAARFFKRLDTDNDGVVDGFEVAYYEHKMVPELYAEAEGQLPISPGGDHASGGPGGGQGGGGPGGGSHGHRRGGGGGEQARESGKPGDTGRGRPRQPAFLQLIGEPEPVSGADFNLDSRITLDEWMRATDQRFDILDEKKDGKLTLDELKARFTEKPKSP